MKFVPYVKKKECDSSSIKYYGSRKGILCYRIIEHYGYWENGELKVMKKGIEYYEKLIKK